MSLVVDRSFDEMNAQADSGPLSLARTSKADWRASGLVFLAALAVLLPTTGDFGLTYDEPAYAFSQQVSIQWWEQLFAARSLSNLKAMVDRDTLLYYWPYARYGINFHPPLAGQLNLLTYQLLHGFVRETVARRAASVFEFALAITFLFGFLHRRYGAATGLIAAGSLLLMPRLYGQAHLTDTDIPGVLIWLAAALAFWKGLHEPHARRWRIACGLLVGLAFVEKMGTVMVLLPLMTWLALSRMPAAFRATPAERRRAWIDGLITTSLMLLPLALAFVEVRRLADAFLALQRARGIPTDAASHARIDLFRDHPSTWFAGPLLALPLVVWLMRRALARLWANNSVWGRERPALETIWSILAFAPVVAWLGNPAWWVETMPRLAHYYGINTARQGVLPRIQNIYFGQIYEYGLPWHNAWVLIGITVPTSILIATVVGLFYCLARMRRDRLPLFFLVNMATLPVLRMFDFPAHDGVRLFLPTFAFLAAFAGWGAIWLADGLSRLLRVPAAALRALAAALVLAPAAWSLASIHPYELSYYNALIGGPQGAWQRGFELTYWYDAFTPQAVADLNVRLPRDAHVNFPNDLSSPGTFDALQAMGELRSDIHLNRPEADYPFVWLLTHDSKAMATTRLLFVLKPWYEEQPRQLDGARVLAVADPHAVALAVALQLLTDDVDREQPPAPAAPAWVRRWTPWLARFWGDGLIRAHKLVTNDAVFQWAEHDPNGLRSAARTLIEWAKSHPSSLGAAAIDVKNDPVFVQDPAAWRLYETLTRYDGRQSYSADLLRKRPQVLLEAVDILCRRGNDVRRVLTRSGFTDPTTIGGYLDRDITAGP